MEGLSEFPQVSNELLEDILCEITLCMSLETSEDSVYKILFLCVCILLCLLHAFPVHFILVM